MAYATLADLTDRYGDAELTQLTDRAGAGAIDPAIAARALDDAAAEIDGYLAVRYALPLATVPTVLVRIACDIARYRLWDDRASDEVRRRYEDARRVLERIAGGDVSLGLPAASGAPLELAEASIGNPRLFTRTETDGY